MKVLPDVLYLYVLEFLPYEEKVQLTSTCRSFYHTFMKKDVRVLYVVPQNLKRVSERLSLIASTNKQVICRFSQSFRPFPVTSVFSLSCKLSALHLSVTDSTLEVTSLSLTIDTADQAILLQVLTSIDALKLKTLSITLPHTINLPAFSLPDLFPHLTSFALTDNHGATVLPTQRFAQLQKLELVDCDSLTDVSMLGKVHTLILLNCPNLVDISALNDNHTVRLLDNGRITDFTKSFANSVQIELRLASNGTLDLSRWHSVQTLGLSTKTNAVIPTLVSHVLPATVIRASLDGDFTENIDWQSEATFLTELALSNNSSYRDLRGLSLQRLTVVRLFRCSQLTSLEGMGGKNQVVMVSSCGRLTDFSALRGIPTVSISTGNFHDVGVLRGVKDLSLGICLETIQNLDEWVKSSGERGPDRLWLDKPIRLTTFQGCERIGHLELSHESHVTLLKDYLVKGGILYNRKITIHGPSPGPMVRAVIADLVNRSHRYMIIDKEDKMILLRQEKTGEKEEGVVEDPLRQWSSLQSRMERFQKSIASSSGSMINLFSKK